MSINNKEIKAMGLTPIPEHIYTDKTLIKLGKTLSTILLQGYIDKDDLIDQSYTTSIKVLVEAEGLIDSYSLVKGKGDQYIDFDLAEEPIEIRDTISSTLGKLMIDGYNS